MPTMNQEGKEYPTNKRMSGNCLGHILCRTCLLKHITEGKIEGRIEVMGRQGRKHKQLMNDIKEERG